MSQRAVPATSETAGNGEGETGRWRASAVRRAQHEYVSEWVHLLRLSQPQLDLVTARIRVHAVLSVANDAGRSAQFLGTPPAPEAVVVIATGLLGLPPHSSV